MSDDFFSQSLNQSKIKMEIVFRYFVIWSRIIGATVKKSTASQKKIGYVDLFSGRGIYDDGTKSTPILILEYAITNQDISEMLETHFNDANTEFITLLEKTIKDIPNIDKLKYKPKFTNFKVDEQTIDEFYGKTAIPTLFFLDPWGYKGLSLELFNVLLKGWGCECIFFFNYNRIRAAIDNKTVNSIINALFGEERANHLRMKTNDLNSEESEFQIVDELTKALKDIGGTHVLPFRFKDENGNRTSHYLIFVSKSIKGYEKMKEIMANVSSIQEQGVASLEFNRAIERQPTLFELARPLDDLKVILLKHFAGQTLSVEQIYITHTKGTRYRLINYKNALKELESEGLISIKAPDGKMRRKGTFADHLIVTFPPKA